MFKLNIFAGEERGRRRGGEGERMNGLDLNLLQGRGTPELWPLSEWSD